MAQKIKVIGCITSLLLVLILNNLFAGQFLDANGHLKGFTQENDNGGYTILDEEGHAKAYIQEDGDNGYVILDSEGKAIGFYEED